jgi:hypothetical protein
MACSPRRTLFSQVNIQTLGTRRRVRWCLAVKANDIVRLLYVSLAIFGWNNEHKILAV